jgi:hypothetical protein
LFRLDIEDANDAWSSERDRHARLVQELGAIPMARVIDLERDGARETEILGLVHGAGPPPRDLPQEAKGGMDPAYREGRFGRVLLWRALSFKPEVRAPRSATFDCSGMVQIEKKYALDGGQCRGKVPPCGAQVGEEDAGIRTRDMGQEALRQERLAAVDERGRGCHRERIGQRAHPGATNESLESESFVRSGPNALEDDESLGG